MAADHASASSGGSSPINSEDEIDDVAKHPVSCLWKAWKGSNKRERKSFDFQPFRASFATYLSDVRGEEYCYDVFHGRTQLTCTCMSTMPLEGDELEKVVSALVSFSTKTKLERNYLLADWIRYARCSQDSGKGPKAYLLPGGNHFVCQHALSRVCGMKSYAWRGLCKKVRDGVALDHGLTGKDSNRANLEAQVWMDSFLSRLEEQAAPRATRTVRYLNKDGNYVQEVRDDDIDWVDLPSHCTRRGLYNQFVAERGWKFIYDPKNRILDKVAIDGMEQNPDDPSALPSINSFKAYWDKHFPKMKIQSAAADICDECFVFANQVRYRQRLTGKEGADALKDDMEDDRIANDSVKEKESDALQAETLILNAAEHVNKQQKQRKLFKHVKDQARNQILKGTSVQIHTFVADYSQNMSVPNLAGEQPGKAYYLSPLSAFVFGVVDCSNKKTSLAAHTYLETDGKKGGNNVASMLWNEFTRKGLTAPGGTKEINIVMDNCGGQNKNRMVLRLLFVLVNLKVCFKARMIFLVKGHTKNDCDRMFNLMKKMYRNTNCYTPKQLFEFINNSHEDVELVDVMNTGGFVDWDRAQNKYMRIPESIQKYHVFTVNRINPDRLICQEADGYPLCFDDKIIRKQYRGKEWAKGLMKELQPLKKTGMKDIKWITLYDEWRPLIPIDFRQEYQYFCQDPGTERREKTRINRGEAAQTRLNRAVTDSKAAVAKPKATSKAKQQSTKPISNNQAKKKKAQPKQKKSTTAPTASKPTKRQRTSKGPFVL
jgi:hypothetical protein